MKKSCWIVETKEQLRMETRKRVMDMGMDRAPTALEGFEAYVHKNQLDEILPPKGRWRPVHATSVTSFLIQDFLKRSLSERVKARLKWSERDETD